MKTNLLITVLFICAVSVIQAQWTIDPANPTIVCDAPGGQEGAQSIADGEGGLYTFWYDARTGNNLWDVYGQHYDADGQALWEENGREIINHEGRINLFSFVRLEDGDFLFAFTVNYSTITTDNGVYVRKVNPTGAAVWPDDVRVFDATSYPNSLGSARIVKSLDYFYVATSGTVIGGSNTCRINKIDSDGNLLWPVNGSTVPGMGSFGNYGITSDQNGGLYVYKSSGNGSGASLRCMRIEGTDNLTNTWPEWRNVTEGTQGLNYQFSGIGDADGITFVWIGGGEPAGTGNNVYARRLLASNGLLGWNETTKHICVANGNQDRFFWKKSGNNYFITWADGRPGVVGNSAIYAQKFTINGIILWEENGVQAANLNTYIPNPEFDLDENNTMCIAHKANTGFTAHKISNDGVVSWGPAGVVTFSNSYAPFYEDFNVVYTEDKFIVIASNGNNVFMNKIHPAPVQESETASACNSYTAHGETYTSSGVYSIQYHPDTILTLNLTIIHNESEIEVDGFTFTAINDGGFQWYNCDTNLPIEGEDGPIFTATESGSYALQLTNGECVDMSECIEITIVSMSESLSNTTFSIYPNPSNGQFSIDSSEPMSDIVIYNCIGEIVYHEKNKSAKSVITLNGYPTGIYYYRILQENQLSKTGAIIIQ